MTDPRMNKLADLLVGYSTDVQPGENVLIEAFDIPAEMVCALVKRVKEAEGRPFVKLYSGRVRRAFYMNATPEAMKIYAENELEFMKKMDCYIAIRGGGNSAELSDVPEDHMKMVGKALQPVTDLRVNETKWVVLRWPSPSMAQSAGMSTEAFEDFYFDVCTLDYARMSRAEQPLVKRMTEAKTVRIIGPLDTDITFSVEGIAGVPCEGDRNIPDGEVYTAPVKNSVNGVMHYNTGTVYNGKNFDDVRLVFKDGKIIEATGSDTEGINSILDTDEGARYVGEFSLGFNPHIKNTMRDILFDEKVDGSFHFTPGQAYEDADNGNRSDVHWDMVAIQRPDYGGGEIWFDDELIRKDGRFVPDYLQCLNPENLI